MLKQGSSVAAYGPVQGVVDKEAYGPSQGVVDKEASNDYNNHNEQDNGTTQKQKGKRSESLRGDSLLKLKDFYKAHDVAERYAGLRRI